MNSEIANPLAAIAAGFDGKNTSGWFIHSAGVALALTGLAKVWSTLGSVRLLAVADPITGLQFGHLMLAVGLLELVIAGICLFSKAQKLSLALIAWLATNFVVYRLGLWWMGWHKPCGCLGNLTDALHISPATADHIMKGVLAYLLIGSYWLLWTAWIARHPSAAMQARASNALVPPRR
jgi:hypothetical protein